MPQPHPCGSAYGVVLKFAEGGLRFPKRAYGGVWAGKLIWDHVNCARVLSILKNPTYAGAYTYGRTRATKTISTEGHMQPRTVKVPRDQWQVLIEDHHDGYIGWDEFLANQERLQRNRSFSKETMLSGPAREGLALLQGLLICSHCGRRLTVRYTGNGGIYPTYNCIDSKRERTTPLHRLTVRCEVIDAPVSARVLEVLVPSQLDLALQAVQELERRDEAITKQWRMRLERADYEAQLAQKSYEEVDPSNRLVAATLETRWNDKLVELEQVKQQFEEFQQKHALVATPEQRAKVLALAEDFPRLWNAPTTAAKDRKRMLRLLIKDITVEKEVESRRVLLRIRWQGGACETLTADLPPNHIMQQEPYSDEMIERIRTLAQTRSDPEVAAALNDEGRISITGRPFTKETVRWIRKNYGISRPDDRRPDEFTVQELAEKLGVSRNVVYRWIARRIVESRRTTSSSPHWVSITPETEAELRKRINASRSSSELDDQARAERGGAV